MATFLSVLIEGGGNVPAQVSVLRRLAARGHRVHVLGDLAVEPAARQAGASFHPFVRAPHQNMRDRHADLVRDFEPRTPMGQFRRVGDRLFFGPAEAYARDVLEAVDRLAPDALTVDILCVGAMAGAERSGLPTAALCHMPFSVPLEGVTPLGTGFLPARGPLGRLRDRLFRGLIVRTFDSGLPRLNAARAALGLAPLRHVFDQFQVFPRTLVLASPRFDFVPPRPPPNVRWVGAQLDDPAWAEPWTSPWPKQAPEPLVLVSLGSTYQRQERTLARLVEALGTLPVRGLVTLGGQLEPAALPSRANVVCVGSAPHALVLPQVSVVVCHGGHGTVMKALSHGLPVVCLPFGRDQKDNGARLRHAGAGIVLPPSASAGRLAAAISRALGDPSLRQHAQRLRAAIAEESERDEAVSELEALAKVPGGVLCVPPPQPQRFFEAR